MTLRRTLIAATLAAGSLAAAHAGELTLYTHANFHGQPLTLNRSMANVSETGFNDRASSIVVGAGRWEVCTDANFQGHCAVLSPGEYDRLDPRFNDRISSARELGNRRGGRDRAALVELYDQQGFRGQRLALDRGNQNLVNSYFNDRTSSIVVRAGTWEVCSAAQFEGHCVVLGPGHYDHLGAELTDRVSSVRPLGRGGRDRERDRGHGGAPVELFNVDGARMAAWNDVVSLGGTPFNDRVAALVVNQGQWEMCSAAGFRGQCVVMGPGQYAQLGQLGTTLSSMRRVQ